MIHEATFALPDPLKIIQSETPAQHEITIIPNPQGATPQETVTTLHLQEAAVPVP